MEQIGRPSKRKPKSPPRNLEFVRDALQYADPIDAIWLTLVETYFRDPDNPSLSNLTRPCQALYMLDIMDREVQNGGFDQFFYNSSGNLIEETRWALSETGAVTMLALLDQAIAVFPNGIVPRDRFERTTILREFSDESNDRLSQLDSEFNSKLDSVREEKNEPENPWYLALRYMRANADAKIAAVNSSAQPA